MNYDAMEIGQIVIVEKEGNPYEGFYGKVVFKGNPEEDGRYYVKVALHLKEIGDEVITMDVEFAYEDLADDDGYWDPDMSKHGCPTIIDQFNMATEAFEEQCGGFPCEDEVMGVFNNGDYCRALRYVLDTQKWAYALCERIHYDNELMNR